MKLYWTANCDCCEKPIRLDAAPEKALIAVAAEIGWLIDAREGTVLCPDHRPAAAELAA